MKYMKKSMLLMVAFMVLASQTALVAQTNSVDEADRDEIARREYLTARDQVAESFARELYKYEIRRENGRKAIAWGVLGGILAMIAGSTAQTLKSAEMLDSTFADNTVYGSYGVAVLSAVAFGVGWRVWVNGSDGYLDTLRLQTQYYNLIDY